MKLGYFTLTDNPSAYGEQRQDANRLLLDTIEQALAAERLGFNSVWLPEHHFGGFGVMPTPNQCLAYIAARTERVKLAQATVLLPCNQPLRAAEEVATLDLLSNGRAIFSAGRGYDEREYRAFGIPFAESRSRFDEELDLIRKAWTETDFTFHGQHHTIPDPITVYPRPVQQPHPPGSHPRPPATRQTPPPAGLRRLLQRADDASRRRDGLQHHLRAVRGGHDVRQPESGGRPFQGVRSRGWPPERDGDVLVLHGAGRYARGAAGGPRATAVLPAGHRAGLPVRSREGAAAHPVFRRHRGSDLGDEAGRSG